MNKQDVIAFFDRLAPQWDADMVRKEPIISKILDNAGIRPGIHVLDVACGTGVLFPDYFSREVASLTAIDISPEMAKLARKKFPNAKVLCGDVEQTVFDRKFDAVVVYNAFPHFPDPEKLIAILSDMLVPGGILTVAHGMSRAHIDRHHQGSAGKVSMGLMHEDALAEIFARHLTVTTKISDEEMYQVAGKKA